MHACMHVTIITVAFHFKRLQNSEYQNMLITVAEKQPIIAGNVCYCAVETTSSRLLEMTM